MKKERKLIPVIFNLISIPFYFFGFYSLRAENRTKILGTYRFFQIGLTRDYGIYRQYFFTEGPHFINAVVILLIVSFMMVLSYCIVLGICKSKLTEKQYIKLSLTFSCLSYCFYASAVVIGVVFYSNIFHASYVIQGKGHLGFSAAIISILQFTALFIHYFNFIDYVLSKKEYKEIEKSSLTDSQKNITEWDIKRKILNSNHFYLVGSKGEYEGGKIEILENKELIIGKDPTISAVVINKKYQKVSRKHCGIIRKGYCYYIKDYSKNGTYLSFDGSKMQTGGVLNKVESGQKFNLAKTDNEFYCQTE